MQHAVSFSLLLDVTLRLSLEKSHCSLDPSGVHITAVHWRSSGSLARSRLGDFTRFADQLHCLSFIYAFATNPRYCLRVRSRLPLWTRSEIMNCCPTDRVHLSETIHTEYRITSQTVPLLTARVQPLPCCSAGGTVRSALNPRQPTHSQVLRQYTPPGQWPLEQELTQISDKYPGPHQEAA